MLDHVREMFAKGDLDAIWKWCMEPDGPHGKAKRFGACAVVCRQKRDKEKKPAERKKWEERRESYDRARDKWTKKYENKHDDADWPEDIFFTEFLYHSPPHAHMASANRDALIQLAKVGQERFGLRIGEFPPFDPVEDVHVGGSWHYRDSSNPSVPRSFANRGNGLAFDANDLDGGNDQEYAFFIECSRRYR